MSVSGSPLRPLDRFLRWWRIRKVRRIIPHGAVVLDVGCHDGALFRSLADRIAGGVGVDPLVERSGSVGPFRFVSGSFPDQVSADDRFDVITLLAVLEHVEPDRLLDWSEACRRFLAPGGLLIATVPSPVVDRVLHVLTRARLVAGMSVDEHHGFDPSQVPEVFVSPPFSLIRRQRFEFGMNNLFVFRSIERAGTQFMTERA